MNIASWQPTVTMTESGEMLIPSSAASSRAISSCTIPLVRPYWKRVWLTRASLYPRSVRRYSQNVSRYRWMSLTSKNSSHGRPEANETASG